MANITGWGRGTWSEGAWNEALPVEPTGLTATGNVGDVTVELVQPVSVTGVSSTGVVDSVSVEEGVGVSVTGVSATGNIGNVFTFNNGLEATGGIGSVSITGTSSLSLTGVAATGVVGDGTQVVQDQSVNVTGLSATGNVGNVFTFNNGLEATGAVGSVSVEEGAGVSVTGVSANATVTGSIIFTGLGDAQISTAQSKFGGASLLLDGTGDSVVSNDTYNFGGDPFTIEMWVRPANATQDAVFFDSRDSTSNDSIALRQSTDNLLVVRGSGTLFNIDGVFAADTWVHIAVTRGDPFGNTYSVFVDGVEQDSTLFGATATAANLHIGSDFNGSNNWEGYIDELRVSDVDRYEGEDFTPATSEFTADENTPVLLHFDGSNGSTTFTNNGFVLAVTVTGDANVPETGLSATASVGTVIAKADVEISVTGFSVTGSVGEITHTGDANVFPIGITATGTIGNVTVWGRIVPDPGTTWSEIAA